MRDLNKFNQDDLRLNDDNYELIAEFMNLSDNEKMLMLDVHNKLIAAEKQLTEGKVLDGDVSLKSIKEKYNV